MTDYTTLELGIDGAVARIWLNRPEMRNAIDDVFIRELGTAFAEAEAAPGVRAVVLGGRGPAFCAGANHDPRPAVPACAPLRSGRAARRG